MKRTSIKEESLTSTVVMLFLIGGACIFSIAGGLTNTAFGMAMVLVGIASSLFFGWTFLVLLKIHIANANVGFPANVRAVPLNEVVQITAVAGQLAIIKKIGGRSRLYMLDEDDAKKLQPGFYVRKNFSGEILFEKFPLSPPAE